MTAREPAKSQPTASPDPLSATAAQPAANTAQPGTKHVQPAEKNAAAEKTSEQPKKKISALLILGVIAVLVVAGGGAAGFFLMPKSAPPVVAKSPPIPPDPGAAPPPPQFTFAQAKPAGAALTASQEHLELVAAAAKRLQARMFVGSGEAAAPREFLVRGGGASDAAGLALPNHERWEIQFPSGLTIEAYTRQLDFFKIELGVVGGSQQVTYLSNLSNPKPRVRTGPGNTETRLYLIWGRGPMREADEILVARAGLSVEGKVLAHFCPPELEAEMLRIEEAHARTNNVANVRRTVFGIQPVAADTFRLFVAEQKGD